MASSSSEKFLLKHFGKKDISTELQHLPEEKIAALEIQDPKFDRAIKYKSEQSTIRQVLSSISGSEKAEFVQKIITNMLRAIDSSAEALSEGRAMREPGSMVFGNYVDSIYSATLRDDKQRRATLKHLLEQLL
jgi:translation initiation factor 1 (eIF-1/SUI1)